MSKTQWLARYRVIEQEWGWEDEEEHEWSPVYVEAWATAHVNGFHLNLFPEEPIRVSNIEYGDDEEIRYRGRQVARELALEMRAKGFNVKVHPKRTR